ncbi:MAG: inositol monophosphatase family protein [Gammaproteobacteria bacterium]
MPRSPVHWLAFLERIAERADRIARQFFRSPELKVESKPDLSPVTEADKAIERMARALAREECPELDVLGEEQGSSQRSGPLRLIVDPIDATHNFARGIPVFATLLAIEEADEVVAGIVSAPALGTRWKAARGAGAFRGNDPIRVSTIKHIESAQVFHSDVLGSAEAPHPPPGVLRFMRGARRARGFGDFYQHVLVAEGGGEIALDPQLQPWDIAPLQVIVEEAGGKATTLDGRRSIYGGSLLTSNGLLHAQALEAVFDRAP